MDRIQAEIRRSIQPLTAIFRSILGNPTRASSTRSDGSDQRLLDVPEQSVDRLGLPADDPEVILSMDSGVPYNERPIDELFDLSLCSDEARLKVGDVKLGVTRLSFGSAQLAVYVANPACDGDETRMDFQVLQRPKVGKLHTFVSFMRSKLGRNIRKRQICGNTVELQTLVSEECGAEFDALTGRSLHYSKQFFFYAKHVTPAYQDLVKHTFEIFPNDAPLVFLDMRGINVAHFSYIPNDLLRYEQIRRSPCLGLTVNSNEFVEQAHIVLELMRDLRNVILHVTLSDTEFFSPRLTKLDHLTIQYKNNTISHDNFLSLDCETIKLWCVEVAPETLNAFIKQWKYSESRRLHYLEIPVLCSKVRNETEFKRRVLDGLDAEPWDESRRAPLFKEHDWNYHLNCRGKSTYRKCQFGWDVVRDDGLLGTAVFSPTMFHFFVWHDRFPEQPAESVEFMDRHGADSNR